MELKFLFFDLCWTHFLKSILWFTLWDCMLNILCAITIVRVPFCLFVFSHLAEFLRLLNWNEFIRACTIMFKHYWWRIKIIFVQYLVSLSFFANSLRWWHYWVVSFKAKHRVKLLKLRHTETHGRSEDRRLHILRFFRWASRNLHFNMVPWINFFVNFGINWHDVILAQFNFIPLLDRNRVITLLGLLYLFEPPVLIRLRQNRVFVFEPAPDLLLRQLWVLNHLLKHSGVNEHFLTIFIVFREILVRNWWLIVLLNH